MIKMFKWAIVKTLVTVKKWKISTKNCFKEFNGKFINENYKDWNEKLNGGAQLQNERDRINEQKIEQQKLSNLNNRENIDYIYE